MADLINIQGLFSNILNTPEQMAQEQLNRNVGLFNQGMAGTLGEARSNFQNNLRGSVQQLGSAINPNFDVRTADQQFRSAVNAIDPEDEQAREKYIAATKQFAPSKLPSLMENLKRQDLEEEELSFKREERTQKRVEWGNNAEAVEQARNRAEQLSTVTGLQIAELNQDVEAQKAARSFLTSSQQAKDNPNYAAQVATMSAAELQVAVRRIGAEEGTRNTKLGDTLKEQFKDNKTVLALIDDMTFEAKQSVQAQVVANAMDPGDFSVVKLDSGSYVHNSKDNSFTIIEAATTKVKQAPVMTDTLAKSLVDNFLDIDNGKFLDEVSDVMNDGEEIDERNMLAITTRIQQRLFGEGKAGTLDEITQVLANIVAEDKADKQEGDEQNKKNQKDRVDALEQDRQLANVRAAQARAKAVADRIQAASTIPVNNIQ